MKNLWKVTARLFLVSFGLGAIGIPTSIVGAFLVMGMPESEIGFTDPRVLYALGSALLCFTAIAVGYFAVCVSGQAIEKHGWPPKLD